jgi:hypothetical protein
MTLKTNTEKKRLRSLAALLFLSGAAVFTFFSDSPEQSLEQNAAPHLREIFVA